ncbi:hypothetical protein FHG87_002817 [Trinorchestia longiramus]|nr:hypothetical protein FHG87_002817 [Trinorchestia longiramus]
MVAAIRDMSVQEQKFDSISAIHDLQVDRMRLCGAASSTATMALPPPPQQQSPYFPSPRPLDGELPAASSSSSLEQASHSLPLPSQHARKSSITTGVVERSLLDLAGPSTSLALPTTSQLAAKLNLVPPLDQHTWWSAELNLDSDVEAEMMDGELPHTSLAYPPTGMTANSDNSHGDTQKYHTSRRHTVGPSDTYHQQVLCGMQKLGLLLAPQWIPGFVPQGVRQPQAHPEHVYPHTLSGLRGLDISGLEEADLRRGGAPPYDVPLTAPGNGGESRNGGGTVDLMECQLSSHEPHHHLQHHHHYHHQQVLHHLQHQLLQQQQCREDCSAASNEAPAMFGESSSDSASTERGIGTLYGPTPQQFMPTVLSPAMVVGSPMLVPQSFNKDQNLLKPPSILESAGGFGRRASDGGANLQPLYQRSMASPSPPLQPPPVQASPLHHYHHHHHLQQQQQVQGDRGSEGEGGSNGGMCCSGTSSTSDCSSDNNTTTTTQSTSTVDGGTGGPLLLGSPSSPGQRFRDEMIDPSDVAKYISGRGGSQRATVPLVGDSSTRGAGDGSPIEGNTGEVPRKVNPARARRTGLLTVTERHPVLSPELVLEAEARMNRCYSPLHLQRQLQRQLSQDNQRRLGLSIPEEEDCDSQDEVTTRSGPCLASCSVAAVAAPHSSLATAFSLDSSSGMASKYAYKAASRSKRRLSDSMCSLLNEGAATTRSITAGRPREKLSLSAQLLNSVNFSAAETSSSGSIMTGRPRTRRSFDMSGGITSGRPVRGGRFSETSAPRIDLLDTDRSAGLELLRPVLWPGGPWGSNTSSSNSISSSSSSSTTRLTPLVPSSTKTSARSTVGGITAGLPVCQPCDITLPSIVSGLPVCNSTIAGITLGVPMTHLRGSNSYGIVSGIPPFPPPKFMTVVSDMKALPVSSSVESNSNFSPTGITVPGILSGIPVKKPSHDTCSTLHIDSSDVYSSPRPLLKYPSRSSLVNETSSPGLVQSLNEMEINDDAYSYYSNNSNILNSSSHTGTTASASAYRTRAHFDDNFIKSHLLEVHGNDSPMDDVSDSPLANSSVSSSFRGKELSAPSSIVNFNSFYPESTSSKLRCHNTNVPLDGLSNPGVEPLSTPNSGSVVGLVDDLKSLSSAGAGEVYLSPVLSSHENVIAPNSSVFGSSSCYASVIQNERFSSNNPAAVSNAEWPLKPDDAPKNKSTISSDIPGNSAPSTIVSGSSDQALKDLLLSWQKSQPGFSSSSISGQSSSSSFLAGSIGVPHSKQQSPYQRPRTAGKYARQRRTGLATLVEICRPSEQLSPASSPGFGAAPDSPALQKDETFNN